MYRVLHFDDSIVRNTSTGEDMSFSHRLSSRLNFTFKDRDFLIEPVLVKTPQDYANLKDRVSNMPLEDGLHLILIDLRLDLHPSGTYRDGSKMEGLEIAKILHDRDPERYYIDRSFLTRTVNQKSIQRLGSEVAELNVDFLSKQTLTGEDDCWTINEAFPFNVEKYIEQSAQKRGIW